MSLEDAIMALTAAVEANTAALGGDAAPAKSTGGKAASGKAASGGKAKKGPTVDQIAELAGKYLGTGNAAAKKAAIANMKKLNTKYEVAKITEADEDNYEDIVADLTALIDGEDPFEEEDGDEDGSLV